MADNNNTDIPISSQNTSNPLGMSDDEQVSFSSSPPAFDDIPDSAYEQDASYANAQSNEVPTVPRPTHISHLGAHLREEINRQQQQWQQQATGAQDEPNPTQQQPVRPPTTPLRERQIEPTQQSTVSQVQTMPQQADPSKSMEELLQNEQEFTAYLYNYADKHSKNANGYAFMKHKEVFGGRSSLDDHSIARQAAKQYPHQEPPQYFVDEMKKMDREFHIKKAVDSYTRPLQNHISDPDKRREIAQEMLNGVREAADKRPDLPSNVTLAQLNHAVANKVLIEQLGDDYATAIPIINEAVGLSKDTRSRPERSAFFNAGGAKGKQTLAAFDELDISDKDLKKSLKTEFMQLDRATQTIAVQAAKDAKGDSEVFSTIVHSISKFSPKQAVSFADTIQNAHDIELNEVQAATPANPDNKPDNDNKADDKPDNDNKADDKPDNDNKADNKAKPNKAANAKSNAPNASSPANNSKGGNSKNQNNQKNQGQNNQNDQNDQNNQGQNNQGQNNQGQNNQGQNNQGQNNQGQNQNMNGGQHMNGGGYAPTRMPVTMTAFELSQRVFGGLIGGAIGIAGGAVMGAGGGTVKAVRSMYNQNRQSRAAQDTAFERQNKILRQLQAADSNPHTQNTGNFIRNSNAAQQMVFTPVPASNARPNYLLRPHLASPAPAATAPQAQRAQGTAPNPSWTTANTFANQIAATKANGGKLPTFSVIPNANLNTPLTQVPAATSPFVNKVNAQSQNPATNPSVTPAAAPTKGQKTPEQIKAETRKARREAIAKRVGKNAGAAKATANAAAKANGKKDGFFNSLDGNHAAHGLNNVAKRHVENLHKINGEVKNTEKRIASGKLSEADAKPELRKLAYNHINELQRLQKSTTKKDAAAIGSLKKDVKGWHKDLTDVVNDRKIAKQKADGKPDSKESKLGKSLEELGDKLSKFFSGIGSALKRGASLRR